MGKITSLAPVLLSLLVGCEGDPEGGAELLGTGESPAAADPAGEAAADLVRTETAVVVPGQLSCVSGASRQAGEDFPGVWRVHMAIGGQTASVTLRRGPQFPSHAGTWTDSEDGDPPTRTAQVVAAEFLALKEEGLQGFEIVLWPSGGFWVGTLVVDSRDHASLTCWDEGLTSSWGGISLGVNFDWASGRCLDAAGYDARNVVPIEFVRETRFGECADLRGTALNGEDTAEPDLEAWELAGADLREARLTRANLENAQLGGARMVDMVLLDATVSGSVDGFTEPPADASCSVQGSPWSGYELTCAP